MPAVAMDVEVVVKPENDDDKWTQILFTERQVDQGTDLCQLQCVCVECLVGKQYEPTLFKVTEPSSVPYRTPSACAKLATYPDPPPVSLQSKSPL